MANIIIKGVETADEQDTVNDLVTKVHYPGYYPARQQLDAFIANYPEYHREHTRMLLADGQLAACLCLFTHTIRIGEARIKMGGIGNVATAGPWRGKGCAALLMGDVMHYMKSHGYHLSMLFGIADFYYRWGFTSVLPDYTSAVELKEAEVTESPACRERAVKPGDIPGLLRIHNRNDSESSCSIIRSSGHFTNRWERWKEARILTDPRGKVVAYFLCRTSGGELHVDELGTAEHQWNPAVLRHCVLKAKNEYASRLRFNLPPSHNFVGYVMRFSSDHEMHVYRNSHGMVAPVNIEETLECMLPEWESALAASAVSDISISVTLVIDRIPYRIRAHHGMLDIAGGPGENKLSITSQEFMQALTGYHHLPEILEGKRSVLTEKVMTLLGILFPKRTPYIWQLDRF